MRPTDFESPLDPAAETTPPSSLSREAPGRFAADSAPIDAQALLERCMGKMAFALSLLAELEASGPAQVAEIEQLAAQADALAIAEAAHTLKGAAGILAASPLREVATNIETSARDGDLGRLGESVKQLQVEMERCIAFIPQIRALGTAARTTSLAR